MNQLIKEINSISQQIDFQYMHIANAISLLLLVSCTYAPKNTTVDNTYNARLMAIGGDSTGEGLSSTTHEEEQYQASEEPRDTCNDQPEMSDVQFALSNAPKTLLQTPSLTLGSTKDEVARIQGTPTQIIKFEYSREEWWFYGRSKITLKKGLIHEWDNSDRNLKIRI
jgi:hypothetical protein